MSGRHRRPVSTAVNVAKIAFTGAVIGGGSVALAGHAGAATDGEWDQVARCESGGNWAINTGNGYQGGLQFNARHLDRARRRRIRPGRAPGHQGPADCRSRARAGHSGPRRMAGLRQGPRLRDPAQRSASRASVARQPRPQRRRATAPRTSSRSTDRHPRRTFRRRRTHHHRPPTSSRSTRRCPRRPRPSTRRLPTHPRHLPTSSRSTRSCPRRLRPSTPPPADAPPPPADLVAQADFVPPPVDDLPPPVDVANWDTVDGGPAPVDQPQAWSLHVGDLPLEPPIVPVPPAPPADAPAPGAMAAHRSPRRSPLDPAALR